MNIDEIIKIKNEILDMKVVDIINEEFKKEFHKLKLAIDDLSGIINMNFVRRRNEN